MRSSPKVKKNNSSKNVSVTILSKNKKVSSGVKRPGRKSYGKALLRKALLSKGFYKVTKILLGILILLASLYGSYTLLTNSFSGGIVVSKSQIVDRVAKLTVLPPGMPEDLVRVEDPEMLRAQNSFYQNVKNGDYILMYPTLAVIYDLRNNTIVAVKKKE